MFNEDDRMKNTLKKRWVVISLAIFCNILWGSAFPFVKIGYEQFQISTTADQILFAGSRFALAGLVLLVFSSIKSRKLPKIQKTNLRDVCAMALIQTTLEYIFFYIGLSNTTGTNGSIVNSCSVFWGVLLAHFVYKNDKITKQKAIGCLVGFAGVLFVTLGEGSLRFAWNGEGFIMMASLAFAVGGIFGKRASGKDDPVVVTGFNLLLGGLLLLAAGLVMGGQLPQVTWTGIACLCYLAALSALAFSIWTLLLKYNPVSDIAFFNFVIPVAGTLLSAILLGENIFRWNYGCALLLVTLGICFIQK